MELMITLESMKTWFQTFEFVVVPTDGCFCQLEKQLTNQSIVDRIKAQLQQFTHQSLFTDLRECC